VTVRPAGAGLSARDAALALLVAVIWGLAFVATRLALDALSPPLLTALRFVVAAAPAVVLPRPPLSWPLLISLGATLFAGQFLLQFFGIALGMPPGLAAVIVQTQALFTIVLAVPVLRETPTPRQALALALACVGLAAIASTVGGDVTRVGFALTLAAALSWAAGNLLLARVAADVDMLALTAWLSLVPPLPALALSLLLDGPARVVASISHASSTALGAALYLGLVATIVAYAIWSRLLRRYPAASVTPFALLVPFVAAGASALVFGERFGGRRLAGMACVLAALAVIVVRGSRDGLLRQP
jgi:O-acetylserine/cysteine efflux transporter